MQISDGLVWPTYNCGPITCKCWYTFTKTYLTVMQKYHNLKHLCELRSLQNLTIIILSFYNPTVWQHKLLTVKLQSGEFGQIPGFTWVHHLSMQDWCHKVWVSIPLWCLHNFMSVTTISLKLGTIGVARGTISNVINYQVLTYHSHFRSCTRLR